MKFACDHCQTRYSIGDDKVRGKVLKIRCKTCGNIITVREEIPVVQAEASTFLAERARAVVARASAPSSPPTAPLSIQWFVAIKGKHQGPYDEGDVARMFRDGKISERSFLWHERLPQWTRIRDLAEFHHVIKSGQSARPTPTTLPPPPPDEDGADIVSLEQVRAQRQRRSVESVDSAVPAVVDAPPPLRAPASSKRGAAVGVIVGVVVIVVACAFAWRFGVFG